MPTPLSFNGPAVFSVQYFRPQLALLAPKTPTFTITATPTVTDTPTSTPTDTVTPTATTTATSTATHTAIPIPPEPVTIDYVYDPLYRLTAANYSTGDYYHYTYDSVGNRLTEESKVDGLPSSVDYAYDEANRLISVDGVPYICDANGNLRSDGANTYTYDSANRLTSVLGPQSSVQYTYNGLGYRLTQNNVHYTLDLNSGLTQVLDDGTSSYLYGNGRISQTSTSTEYFLGDALGSVRQLTNEAAEITLTKAYEPYGEEAWSYGAGQSDYGFAAEWTDANGLIFLRARYYAPTDGRFLSRDTWEGVDNVPASLNRFTYAQNNPIIYTDPSGQWCVAGFSVGPGSGCTQEQVERWSSYYAQEAYLWHKLGEKSEDAYAYIYGFIYEYVDNIVLLPISTGITWLIDELTGCGESSVNYYKGRLYSVKTDQRVIAGRYMARAFLAAQALVELGYGLIGLGGGITISGTGVGAIVGIPASTLSVAIAGHGALVLANLIAREALWPLPPLHFSASSTGGGGEAPSSSKLGQNMDDAGRPRQPNSDAHHIVAGTDRRAADSRKILEREGIGINDADNGAWLPDVFHDRVHKSTYHQEVFRLLNQAEPDTVRDVLKWIGNAIETGNFP
jgi:RHS repeat-associated protein